MCYRMYRARSLLTLLLNTAMELKESLKALGWNLSLEGLSQCVESCQQHGWEPTPRNIEKIAVDCDLRAVGEKVLSEDIIRNLQHQVQGPIVLQVQRVKNVVVPSSSQHLPSPSRRLLRLQLTDGHVHCSAVEMGGPIQNLSPLTPPGTKVRLRGKVEVKNGFLLLDRTSLEHLGGQVEHLLKKWSVQQIVPDNFERSKAGTDGPPPFIPFKEIAPSGKRLQEHSVGLTSFPGRGHSRDQSKRPQQKQERSVVREGPRSGDPKIQKPRFGDRSTRSEDERRHQRDPGRDKTATAQTASRRHDGKAAGYKPSQPSEQSGNENSRERDSHLRTHQQRTGRLSRTEGEGQATYPSKSAASNFDSPAPSTRDSHRQPRQRDDSRPSRSRQRGSQEESGRKTEYQLSDWLDQKLKLNSRSSSDSQRGSDCREEHMRDSLDVEVSDGVRDATREGQYLEYGRKETREGQYPEYGRKETREAQYPKYSRKETREGQYPEYGRKELQSGRKEQRWKEGDSPDGPDAGDKKSTDWPKERYPRPPRFQRQRRDQPSDWLDQKPKPGDSRGSSSRQFGTEHEEIGSESKLEVRDRYGAEKYGQGRKRAEQPKPHSKDRAEKGDGKHFDSGGMKAQRGSSERQKSNDHEPRRHKDRDQLASHTGVTFSGEGEIGRGNSQSQYSKNGGGEPGREKYNWDWVNRGAPCGATKQ